MASLSEPFVRRPVMTMLLTVTVILFGVIGYQRLPVNDLPAVDFPVITVNVNYPGASPETMARNVATPLEKNFLQIPGVELINSTNTQGSTSITLQFALSKSLDAAATDVQSAITQSAGSLPTDLPSPPTFTKVNPNDKPIMYITMTSDSLSEGQLYDYASIEVVQRISILPGVSQVAIFGSKSAIRVKVDPDKLAIRGLTVNDLSTAIQAGTSYVGAGQFDGPQRTYLLQPHGQLETPDDYKNLIIAQKNGQPVYLRDVADVVDTLQDERQQRHFFFRGHNVPPSNVVLAVSRQAGSNAVATAQQVKNLLPIFKRELPQSIQLYLVYDRSVTIQNSVYDVEETLGIAFALVVIVIFVFLGRATDTLIPVVALPMSLLITLLAMYCLHYSIDNLSLLALTLSIGFLVDDAIVFLENAVRRMEAGEHAMEAALNGAQEISFTILSMTLSLAAVFIPLVLMPGILGIQLEEFAVVMIIAILASGLVSLSLTPLMCSRMLAAHEKSKQTWMEKWSHKTIGRVIKSYGNSLHFFLHHKWISLVAWIACLGVTVALFFFIPLSLLPTGDSGFIFGIFNAQEGTSPDRMHEYQAKVDKILADDPDVNIGITVSGITGRLSSTQAFTLAFLKPRDERPSIDKVIGNLTGKMSTIPGLQAFLQATPVLQISSGATGTTQGRFAYTVSGIESKKVYKATQDLVAEMQKHPELFLFANSDLKLSTPNLEIDLLRDQASSYGVSAQTILAALSNAYAQNYVYLIKKSTDEYQVIMEVKDPERTKPENLEKIYVPSSNGGVVPLSAVAQWKEVLGPQAVNHINQFPSATIYFALTPGRTIGEATKFLDKTAAEKVPPDIHGGVQGEALVFKQTLAALGPLFILAIFAMYVILGILYESYVHPLTVLSAVPVAMVGGLVTLLVFNQEMSLYAQVGLFLLIGIVKKNGIMMIDFALQRMAEGLDRVAAVHEACVERFRPIMMTTFAALMGAVPLALGHGADGKSRQPLGMIIVGGLIVSQLITLYVTPALFLYLEAFQENVLDKHPFFRTHRVRHVDVPHHAPAPAIPEHEGKAETVNS
ncbi:MAG TPA: efflux RND transporter permease subunit [Chthoniobacteraceae bacterium]|nr:efflux RND transporter permease subunit [Chthoniobacteraceae bacterium]